MLFNESWTWVRRFAARLHELRPSLWEPTAFTIASLAYQELRDREPEEAAEIVAARMSAKLSDADRK